MLMLVPLCCLFIKCTQAVCGFGIMIHNFDANIGGRFRRSKPIVDSVS